MKLNATSATVYITKANLPAPQMKLWSAANATTSLANAVKPSAAHFRRKAEFVAKNEESGKMPLSFRFIYQAFQIQPAAYFLWQLPW